jgi:hypothetical protein
MDPGDGSGRHAKRKGKKGQQTVKAMNDGDNDKENANAPDQ